MFGPHLHARRAAYCQPRVKELTLTVSSVNNGWRFGDL
jgi:hypothetical protein